MRRRSFLATLAAAFAARRLPVEAPPSSAVAVMDWVEADWERSTFTVVWPKHTFSSDSTVTTALYTSN
jgi:hypothetical protein